VIPTTSLDLSATGADFPAVSRWLKIASLLLLAVWLPATLHCRIEAAGLDLHWLGCHDHDDSTAEHCADDTCHAIEKQPYKSGKESPIVVPPDGCTCALCLTALVCACEACAEPALSATGHAPPPDLAVAWQFSRRAAPPARAPALNA
jgi:hypothetical protein